MFAIILKTDFNSLLKLLNFANLSKTLAIFHKNLGLQSLAKECIVEISARAFKRDSYSNAYLLAKFGFDTAENEPCKVWPIERCSSHIRATGRTRWSGGGRGLRATRRT